MDVAKSVHGVPIRLTDERWEHIVLGHPEMSGRRGEILDAVAKPSIVVRGNEGSLLATRRTAGGMLVVVAYRDERVGRVHPDRLPDAARPIPGKRHHMDLSIVDEVRRIVPDLVKLPSYVESTYDQEADVLYLTFARDAEADDSELTDDDILLRYKGGGLIGITVLHASKRAGVRLPS